MAPINPDLKDLPERSYLGLSKPVETPNFVSETGSLLKDFGGTVSAAATGLWNTWEAFGKQEARGLAEPERDAYMKVLGAADSLVKNPPVPGVQAPRALPYTDESEEAPLAARAEVPALPEGLPGKLEALDGARSSGKLTEKDFYARMAVLAKDVRSRYPAAMRDAIDEEFSKYSGGDPANHYIKAVLQSINEAQGNLKTEYNASRHITDQLTDAGQRWPDSIKIPGMGARYPGSDQAAGPLLFAMLQADPNNPKVHAFIRTVAAEVNKYKADEDVAKKRYETIKARKELVADDAETTYRAFINRETSNHFYLFDKMADAIGIVKDENGNYKPTQVQAEQWVRNIADAQRTFNRRVDEFASKPGEDGAPSLVNRMLGKDGAIKEAYMKVFEKAKEDITHDKYGYTSISARSVKAAEEDRRYAFLKDGSDLSKVSFELSTIEKALPSFAKEQAQTYWKEHLPDILNVHLNKMKASVLMGRTSFADGIDIAKKDGVTAPNYYENLLRLPDRLSSDKADDLEKKAIVEAIANPNGRGLMERIRTWNDKIATLNRFTSDTVVENVKKFGEGNKAIVDNYLSNTKTYVRNLFVSDFKELGDTALPPGGTIRWTPDHQLHYDYRGAADFNIGSSFSGRASRAAIIQSQEDERANQRITSIINRTNDGIKALTRAAKIDPSINPDIFVLQNIQTLGVELGKVEGLPAAIQKEIIARHDAKDYKDILK